MSSEIDVRIGDLTPGSTRLAQATEDLYWNLMGGESRQVIIKSVKEGGPTVQEVRLGAKYPAGSSVGITLTPESAPKP